ncbi:hypothetical protein C1645_812319 [Glomus cerebriforme]|uniref:Uncharacterized protein n=1 Tax=Glomus cerebriforme TaxID=658196 RepID=A0A397TLG8_9GLOM|nr:hypothetical protein C1645_812319 [Glomus cerebriforme]
MPDGQENQENTNVPTVEDVFEESLLTNKSVNKRTNQAPLMPQNKFIRKKRKRIEWTQEELDELEEGMKKFGTNWTLILSMSNGPLNHRTNVQLKDKARNEKRRREREGIPLGVFQKATG